MINKIHLAMIQLYKGDAKRIQHFCKVHSYAKLIAETENVDKKCLFTIEAVHVMCFVAHVFCFQNNNPFALPKAKVISL